VPGRPAFVSTCQTLSGGLAAGLAAVVRHPLCMGCMRSSGSIVAGARTEPYGPGGLRAQPGTLVSICRSFEQVSLGTMFVGDEMQLPVGFHAAQAGLARLAHDGSLTPAAAEAYGDGLAGLVRVGPLGAGIDRAILHRVAQATIAAFMSRLADAMIQAPHVTETPTGE
jgi:hypothetical protein